MFCVDKSYPGMAQAYLPKGRRGGFGTSRQHLSQSQSLRPIRPTRAGFERRGFVRHAGVGNPEDAPSTEGTR